MADLGDCSRARVGTPPAHALNVPPAPWPDVSQRRRATTSVLFASSYGHNDRNVVIDIPVPGTGLVTLALPSGFWIDTVAASNGHAFFYDVGDGTYYARDADGTAAWRVTVDGDTVTVTEMEGGGATGLYLLEGRILSAQSPPPGGRLIAYAPQTAIDLVPLSAEGSATVEGSTATAPSVQVAAALIGAVGAVSFSWVRADAGGDDFLIDDPTAAAPVFTVPEATTSLDATQFWQCTASTGAQQEAGIVKVRLQRTVDAVAATFGTMLTNGAGNWGSGVDRAMLDRFTLADTATLVALNQWILANAAAGGNIKGVVCADNGGVPGAVLAIGAATAVPAGGPRYVRSTFSGEVLTPGNYWIGAVSDNSGLYDMGSGAHTAPNAVIINGTFSYSNPPATCPAPAANYANDLAVYVEYTY